MSDHRLVYIAPLKWSSYSQRPHFMMRYLADNFKIKILWVDPFPVRLPRISDLSRRRDVYNQGTQLHPNITVFSHSPVPVEPVMNCGKLYRKIFLRNHLKYISEYVGKKNALLGIGKPCCLANVLLESDMFVHSFYDAMDDYPEFHTGISRKYVSSIESLVAGSVTEVYVSSHFLQQKFSAVNQSVTLVQNGYDDSFVTSDVGPRVSVGQKTIGYVGTIYHWFDWELVLTIARMMPHVIIKLVGPILGSVPANLPGNIRLLPPCSNEEAMKYMQSFDVGIIPFLLNNATRAVDPIKYYEYRALNLPVISTLFGDMQYKTDDPGLYFVSGLSEQEIVSVVDSAIEYTPDYGAANIVNGATWSSRFNKADILGQYLIQR